MGTRHMHQHTPVTFRDLVGDYLHLQAPYELFYVPWGCRDGLNCHGLKYVPLPLRSETRGINRYQQAKKTPKIHMDCLKYRSLETSV